MLERISKGLGTRKFILFLPHALSGWIPRDGSMEYDVSMGYHLDRHVDVTMAKKEEERKKKKKKIAFFY